MKNFYIYNNFFKIVIDINMIAFYIMSTRYKNINIYKKQLINLIWLKEIFRLENLNLKFFKVQKPSS